MDFFSTKNINKKVSFKEAVLNGLAEDGGLYVFDYNLNKFENNFFDNIKNYDDFEIAKKVIYPYVKGSLKDDEIDNILCKILDINIELVDINNKISVLELFNGPTMAFKDFGATFLAHCFQYFEYRNKKKKIVLVATSGDTGAAVANSFWNMKDIYVVVLYPKGKISQIQKQQMTTLKENIYPVELDGNFDDCQRLVKKAFLDKDIKSKYNIISANSINIARLIPQMLYYFIMIKKLDKNQDYVLSVPSGNLGNLTAGILSKKRGLPVYKFISSTNSNSIFTKYLNSGKFEITDLIPTISNAMDVANPSNLERLNFIYKNDINNMKKDIDSFSFSEISTKENITQVYKDYGYILDTHTSVGYLGIKEYLKYKNRIKGIVLGTAHPIKFKDTILPLIKNEIPIPKKIAFMMNKESEKENISNDYSIIKDYIMSIN